MIVRVHPDKDREGAGDPINGATPAISTHSSAVLLSLPIHITSLMTTFNGVMGTTLIIEDEDDSDPPEEGRSAPVEESPRIIVPVPSLAKTSDGMKS